MDPYQYKRTEAHWKRDIAVSHRRFCQCGDLTSHFNITPGTGRLPPLDQCIIQDGGAGGTGVGASDMDVAGEAAAVEFLLDAAITEGER